MTFSPFQIIALSAFIEIHDPDDFKYVQLLFLVRSLITFFISMVTHYHDPICSCLSNGIYCIGKVDISLLYLEGEGLLTEP